MSRHPRVKLQLEVRADSVDDLTTALRQVEYQIANDVLREYELSGHGWEAQIHEKKGWEAKT